MIFSAYSLTLPSSAIESKFVHLYIRDILWVLYLLKMIFFVMNEKATHKNKIIFPIVLFFFFEFEFYFVFPDIWFNIERIDIIADCIDEQII